MSATLRLAALTVSVALLALTGCSGDDPLEGAGSDSPGASETQTQAPTPDPSASAETDPESEDGGDAEAPELPADAEEHTPGGGLAFTKYFFEVINAAFDSGDVQRLAEISDPQCVFCRQVVGDIAYAYSRGSIKGGQVTVDDIETVGNSDTLNTLMLKFSTDTYEEVGPDGEEVLFDNSGQQDIDFTAQVLWQDDEERWVMRQLAPPSSAQAGEDGEDATATAEPE